MAGVSRTSYMYNPCIWFGIDRYFSNIGSERKESEKRKREDSREHMRGSVRNRQCVCVYVEIMSCIVSRLPRRGFERNSPFEYAYIYPVLTYSYITQRSSLNRLWQPYRLARIQSTYACLGFNVYIIVRCSLLSLLLALLFFLRGTQKVRNRWRLSILHFILEPLARSRLLIQCVERVAVWRTCALDVVETYFTEILW